jgi:hypothetical protein
MELKILQFQERCVKTAENIEMQAEKENFYDLEIARLNHLIEAARLKKIKKVDGASVMRKKTLSTKEGFFGKGGEDSAFNPSTLKSKLTKVNSDINETKARNKILRETLNDLR